MVYDNLAWEAMKKYVPRYAVYDDLEDKMGVGTRVAIKV
jgi:hypothetical protein